MEISITTSSIVLKNKAQISGWVLVLALVFPIFLLGIISFTLYALGDTDLTCQRISANLVNCKKTKSDFLGLLDSSKSFTKITGEEYNAKEEEDSEGNQFTVLTIQLVDDRQVKEEFFSGKNWYYDPSKMVNITMGINSFIKSNAPTFSLHEELHVSFTQVFVEVILLIIASSFILSCEWGALVYFLHFSFSETWTFNKITGCLIYE